MKYNVHFTFLLAFLAPLVIGTAACGDDAPAMDAGPMSQRGYTECADRTCQPGQYCQNNVLCSDGCLSDENCTANQYCDTDNPDIRGVSRCVNTANPDGGPAMDGGTDAGMAPMDAGAAADSGRQHIEDCQQVIERGLECEALPADEEEEERAFCENELTAAEAADFADCVAAPASCEDVTDCYAGDEPCTEDEECNEGGGAHQICHRGACQLGCRDDDHCDTRPGLTHQICQSSSCIGGCRNNDDCNPGDECTAALLCGPAM